MVQAGYLFQEPDNLPVLVVFAPRVISRCIHIFLLERIKHLGDIPLLGCYVYGFRTSCLLLAPSPLWSDIKVANNQKPAPRLWPGVQKHASPGVYETRTTSSRKTRIPFSERRWRLGLCGLPSPLLLIFLLFSMTCSFL